MGRLHTARHEVSPIQGRAYCWSKKVERKDPSCWPLPSEGLIQAGRRNIGYKSTFSDDFESSYFAGHLMPK